jgi:microcystin-dependent protein
MALPKSGLTSGLRSLAIYVGLPLAVLLAAAALARAYDTTWIAAQQPLSATKLKSDLDEVQTRLATLEAAQVPPGAIVAYGGANAPSGWVVCDGSLLDGANPNYAALYAAIGTAFGGDPTHSLFYLPDLRGRFVRGVDAAAGHDPDRMGRMASNPGGNMGDAVGTLQADDFKMHGHGIRMNQTALPGTGSNVNVYRDDGTMTATSNAAGGTETRPVNVSVFYIIKL